ncbi:MAG: hypothetical protein GEV10_25190 [Streptosporangiales bacterium]|nr:hypothetical protein [Streptosporangiales bacterium]
MTDTDTTPLAALMHSGLKLTKSDAADAILGLASVADGLDMRETADRLRDTEQQLQSDTFNLIVMGRFKNGKSTLLNALLGGTTTEVDLAGHKGPMVVDDLPATATLTGVTYAEDPYVKVWSFDGQSDRWPLSRYLRESILDTDQEQSEERFRNIREFEMGFPAKLCQAGVTVFDSPGLDEHPTRTQVTRDATKRCDAAIVVYSTHALMGENEMMDAANLVASGTRVFTVVNLWGDRAVDDRLKGYVWNRYVRDHQGGPAWDPNKDPSSRDIYFVNAKQGRDARYEQDGAGAAESGLAALEERLGRFLIRDRRYVHLTKYVTQADGQALAIEQHIHQRRKAAETDQAKLSEAYELIAPRLAEIGTRPAKLPPIIERFRAEAESTLRSSFTATVAEIRRDLPEHLETLELTSTQGLVASTLKPFQQKKIAREISKAISDFVSGRIARWEGEDVPGVLRPVLERLSTEVENEIKTIGHQFDQIHFTLTGWEVDAEAAPIVGRTERILSAIPHVLLGDVAGAVAGGAGGWRGAVGSAAGAFGAGFVLTALGVSPLAPIFLPAALAASLVLGVWGGGRGLEGRAKKKLMQDADERMLEPLPEEMAPRIEATLRESFAQVQTILTGEVSALIEEERRNIEEMVELNRRDHAERERMTVALDEAAAAFNGHRLALQKSLIRAREV